LRLVLWIPKSLDRSLIRARLDLDDAFAIAPVIAPTMSPAITVTHNCHGQLHSMIVAVVRRESPAPGAQV
jgi:hypothetical protein